jgi:hypothetical protein
VAGSALCARSTISSRVAVARLSRPSSSSVVSSVSGTFRFLFRVSSRFVFRISTVTSFLRRRISSSVFPLFLCIVRREAAAAAFSLSAILPN